MKARPDRAGRAPAVCQRAEQSSDTVTVRSTITGTTPPRPRSPSTGTNSVRFLGFRTFVTTHSDEWCTADAVDLHVEALGL